MHSVTRPEASPARRVSRLGKVDCPPSGQPSGMSFTRSETACIHTHRWHVCNVHTRPVLAGPLIPPWIRMQHGMNAERATSFVSYNVYSSLHDVSLKETPQRQQFYE